MKIKNAMIKALIPGLLPVLMSADYTHAADIEAGEEKAVVCASCHGAQGSSNYDLWPNLTGQKQVYMVRQLKAFRDGSRYDPWMSPIALSLSDQDIDDLALYYSKLRQADR